MHQISPYHNDIHSRALYHWSAWTSLLLFNMVKLFFKPQRTISIVGRSRAFCVSDRKFQGMCEKCMANPSVRDGLTRTCCLRQWLCDLFVVLIFFHFKVALLCNLLWGFAIVLEPDRLRGLQAEVGLLLPPFPENTWWGNLNPRKLSRVCIWFLQPP